MACPCNEVHQGQNQTSARSPCQCNQAHQAQQQTSIKPACICNEKINKNLAEQHVCNQSHREPPPRSDQASLFGLDGRCCRPPNVAEPAPPPKCCPYLVCPCPEPCVIRDKEPCQDKPKCCCHLDCQKSPTGFDVTCKSCCKNCPVEIYCPVPKSCLPRCTSNCPQRYPHHPWCIIDTTNFNAL